MFSKEKKLTPEDKINLMAGFLPEEDKVLQIIAASGFNAEYQIKNKENLFVPLIAWAFLKNGAVLPIVYDHSDRGYFVAPTIGGFVRIVHDNDIEEEDETDVEFEADF